MMTDEAKAAASRLRSLTAIKGKDSVKEYADRPNVLRDVIDVACAALEEIPADTDEPMTVEVLLEEGFKPLNPADLDNNTFMRDEDVALVESRSEDETVVLCRLGTSQSYLHVITVGELRFLSDFFDIPRHGAALQGDQ